MPEISLHGTSGVIKHDESSLQSSRAVYEITPLQVFGTAAALYDNDGTDARARYADHREKYPFGFIAKSSDTRIGYRQGEILTRTLR